MIRQIDIKEYEQFAIQKGQDHFLHSLQWAKTRASINWTYDIIGFKTPIEAAALIMYKKFPYINKYYAYVSRGFIINYASADLLKEFTQEIKKYLKSKKVVSLTIDPDIIYSHLDIDYNVIKKGENANEIFENLKQAGYNHQGFYNNFEGIQPRHTFRIYFEGKTYDDILNNMEKGTKYEVKKSKQNPLNIKQGNINDLDDFMEIMEETTKRNGFGSRDINYYKNIMEKFEDDAKLFFVSINPQKVYEQNKQKLNEAQAKFNEIKDSKNIEELSKKSRVKFQSKLTDAENSIKKLEKLSEELKPFLDKENINLSTSLLITHNKKAWYVYGASTSTLRSYLPNYLAYNTMIEYCLNNNYEFLDLFGVGGELDKKSHVYGLYLMKKGFGGELLEFIGEYDLVINKNYYYIYKTLFPKLKKIRKSLNR